MTDLDRLFRDANDDLRTGLRNVAVPDFEPPRRRPPLVAAALALVLLVGIGGLGQWWVGRDSMPTPDEVVVTTAPEPVEPAPEPAEPAPVEPVEPSETPRFAPGEVRQLTAAEAGEFIMPVPMASAWNLDETHLLLYRTGVNGADHIIVDAATGAIVAVPDINPPDIEQVWWHPLDGDALVYLDGTDLMSWSLASQSTTVIRSFPECEDADSGLSLAPPSSSGYFGFLCHRTGGPDDFGPADLSEPYVVNLDDATVQIDLGRKLESAPRVTAAGDVVLIDVGAGNVAPYELSTFGTAELPDAFAPLSAAISLEDDTFVVVTLADGSEALAAAQYQGDVLGNLVVHPLDGREPIVILDAEAAGGFPASGTRLNANQGAGPSVIAVSISQRSPASPLANKLMVFDLAELDPANPTPQTPIFDIEHDSANLHPNWSTVFVSISPSGSHVAWSSDQGSDHVDTFVVELP